MKTNAFKGAGAVAGMCAAYGRAWQGRARSRAMQGRTQAFCLIVCLLLLSGAENAHAKRKSHTFSGGASWYGQKFHGRKTASGEIYNQHAMTAAHKTLPFGVIVKVHNTRNGKQTLLRVNDRGPFIRGRVVDVSYRGAKALGMTHSGVAHVNVSVVGDRNGEPLKDDSAFYVHAANESSMENARRHAAELAGTHNQSARVIPLEEGRQAVCLGPYPSFSTAQAALMQVEGHAPGKRRQPDSQAKTAASPTLGIMEASVKAGPGVWVSSTGAFGSGRGSLTERMFGTMQKRMSGR